MSYQQPYNQGPPQGYNQPYPQGPGQYQQQYPPQAQYGHHQQQPQYPQHQQPPPYGQQQPPYGQHHPPQNQGPYQPPMSGQPPRQPGPYQYPPQNQGYPPQQQQQQQYQSYPPGPPGPPGPQYQQPPGAPGGPEPGMNPYPPSNCPPAPPGPPGPNNYPPQFQPGPPGPQGPIPPSPGYDPTYIPTGNAAAEADALRKAMKGFGTDEKILINILTSTTSPTQMSLIQQTFNQRHNRSLEKDLTSETSGSFKRAVVMLATGPLASDVTYLHEAMHGMGTDEDALNDVLLGRSNADLTAIKHAYAQKYGKSLVDAVRGELSGKTERFFVMLLDARRPENVYFDPQGVESDVRELHRSSKAQAGTDEVGAFSVFVNSSDQRLVAVAREFERVYHVALEEVIRDEFSGHLKSALLGMLGLAKDKVAFYAGLLKEALFVDEECVDKGRLAYWVVRLHWDPRLFGAVKGFMRGELSAMVRRRVDSGDFRDTMTRLCA